MNIQSVTYNGITFVNVIKPEELELKSLREMFQFSSLHLDDYVNKTQVPKIEVEKNYTLLVLDIPYFTPGTQPALPQTQHKPTATTPPTPSPTAPAKPFPFAPLLGHAKKRRLHTSQVDFFIGKDFCVILHENALPQIDEIFAECQRTLQNRKRIMGNGAGYLAYYLIDILIDGCFPVLKEISHLIDRIDRDLEDAQSETTLEHISVTRRNIVFFQTITKQITPLFIQLSEGKYPELNGMLQPYWSNILDHLLKISNRLEDNRELLLGISESNESYLASKTNEIVKVLTIFSTIILPLTLIASIYGMNINGLPYAQQPYAFALLMIAMTVLAFVLLIIFRLKRWF